MHQIVLFSPSMRRQPGFPASDFKHFWFYDCHYEYITDCKEFSEGIWQCRQFDDKLSVKFRASLFVLGSNMGTEKLYEEAPFTSFCGPYDGTTTSVAEIIASLKEPGTPVGSYFIVLVITDMHFVVADNVVGNEEDYVAK